VKLVLLNTFYPPDGPGGAEQSVRLLAEGLVQRGHQVTVVVTTPDGRARVAEMNGVTVRYLVIRNLYPDPMKAPGGWLKPFWHALDARNPLMQGMLREILVDEQPDVLHSNNLGGISVVAWRVAASLGIPILHTLRDYYLLCPKATMFKNGVICQEQCTICRLYSAPKTALAPEVNSVVGIGAPILARHLKAGLFQQARDQQVIPNGVELPATIQPKAGGRTGPLRLGFLGRLEPSKGPDLLLEAAMRPEAVSSEVYLAGRGRPEYVEGLKSRFDRTGIHYLGQTAPAALFAQVDFLVVPSRWLEPFARVVIEALAHGVPVLCSRQVGAAEHLVEGQTGYLFDQDDAAGLAALIAGLSRADAERMAPLCRAAAEGFRPDRIAARYEAAYQKLVA